MAKWILQYWLNTWTQCGGWTMWRDNDTDFIAELREALKEDMAAIQRENIDLATERQNPEISWEEFVGDYS
ncbi:hypothetical protein [Tatumella citrea]|uniref:hypothetical protein n=1 Tax=Tatumella citrea TaxID=53336 RepID=UPI0012F72C04|nr:hypothetical protein [Tatumella citrea]